MATSQASYPSSNERRRRVFVTKNSEYHCMDGVCVAVRDRGTGAFITDHHAIGLKVSAGISFTPTGGIASAHEAKDVQVGERICLSTGKLDDARNMLTSPVSDVKLS